MQKRKLYLSSSDEEDDHQNLKPSVLPKSAVFDFRNNLAPALQDCNQELDHSQQEGDEEDGNHLLPKMKAQKPKQSLSSNYSAVHLKNNGVSQQKVTQKAITAAYTFKLKSPVPKKKRADPVALFQQTSTAWKKDRFLTSRGNNREGRKLELDRRNKETKTLQ